MVVCQATAEHSNMILKTIMATTTIQLQQLRRTYKQQHTTALRATIATTQRATIATTLTLV